MEYIGSVMELRAASSFIELKNVRSGRPASPVIVLSQPFYLCCQEEGTEHRKDHSSSFEIRRSETSAIADAVDAAKNSGNLGFLAGEF